MNIILLGAHGSGKRTEATLIAKDYCIPAISTGDIIRYNIKNKTKNGAIYEKYINSGQLVPDQMVIDLVRERLMENDTKDGYILDGFPRTVAQAKSLATFAKIDIVIFIDVDFNNIEERILSRKICPNCKTIYNTKTYKNNFCKFCKTKLVKRDDDSKEILKNRFDVYLKQTEPLIGFYKEQNLLYRVNGNNQTDEVYDEIKQILQNEGKKWFVKHSKISMEWEKQIKLLVMH